MSENTFEIVTVGELLKSELKIPDYQRPYRWTGKSVLTLINDINNACESGIPEYRIGSVVLHNKEDKFDIVDGQQRLTTLSILVYYFNKGKECKLLEAKYNEQSYKAINDNYKIIIQKCSEMSNNEKKNFFDYLLNKCTMVRITVNSEQEAFQFFDSQNNRGKALDPHDLLKSYHLREMNDVSEKQKLYIVSKWENTNQKMLKFLFENNLYPLVKWYKNKNGIEYSVKDIDAFKGVKKKSNYNFSIYHRAANLYFEKYNSDGIYELLNGKQLEMFQLTEPIISGERFFEYTLHYSDLYIQVKDYVTNEIIRLYGDENNYLPDNSIGNTYVKSLFINVVMMFVDRFNLKALTDTRLKILYKWSYALRITMKAVYKTSLNNYARGNGRINNGLNMFAVISEMNTPEELDSILLESVEDREYNEKYKYIVENVFGGKSND